LALKGVTTMANEMRDRLVELLKKADENCDRKYIVDYEDAIVNIAEFLVANGVIVPPCYIGQEIWYLHKHWDGSSEIAKGKISMLQQKADKSWKFRITINSSVWDFKTEDIGKRYFLTKDQAEQKLKEMRGGNDL
jgi:hypothetical protein